MEDHSGMPRPSSKHVTKNALLEAGIQIMQEKGYSNTGIQEVLEATKVPKGSFYYYFDSKEDFALQIINYFETSCLEHLRAFFDNRALSPVHRLRAYCEDGIQSLENNQCRKGCLIGNLSQEMADQSEILRSRLQEVLIGQRNRFAECIKEAQEVGQVTRQFNHIDLAEYFHSAWLGSLLRAKTVKSTAPLRLFMQVTFDLLLPAPPCE